MIVIRTTACIAIAFIPLQAIAGVNSKAIPKGAVAGLSQNKFEKAVQDIEGFLDDEEKALRSQNAFRIPLLYERKKGNYSGLFQLFPFGSCEYDRLTHSRSWYVGPIPPLLEHTRIYSHEGQLVTSANSFLGIRHASAKTRSGGQGYLFHVTPIFASWESLCDRDTCRRELMVAPLFTLWEHKKEKQSESTLFGSLPFLTFFNSDEKEGVREQTFVNLLLGGWHRSHDARMTFYGPLGLLGSVEKSEQRREVGFLWSLLYKGVWDSKEDYHRHSVTPFLCYERSKGEKTFRLFHWIRIPLGKAAKTPAATAKPPLSSGDAKRRAPQR
ncbi:MAG: hypothetical protein RLZZ399_2473 [Verrucomicrobiota bacterium]|jgi:hypothetical protein